MNELYAKAVLYSYPAIEKVMEQIDELVYKRALDSMSDFTPCIEQCEKILSYTNQKELLIELKLAVAKTLYLFTEEDKKCFEYKYFKNKPKEYFNNFDSSSRAYFRKQIRLLNKFEKLIERHGINDEKFSKEYMQIDFFKELVKRVKEREKAHELKKESCKTYSVAANLTNNHA